MATPAAVVWAASRAPNARAEALLTELKQNPDAKAQAAEPIARAQKALERAKAARDAGDRRHAPMLEGLALEWAELGRDAVRAKAAEAEAARLEAELAATETRIVRARALLEETIARRGRARERLEELEKPKASPTTPAAEPAKGKP